MDNQQLEQKNRDNPTIPPYFTHHSLDRIVERFPKYFTKNLIHQYKTGTWRPILNISEEMFWKSENRKQIINNTSLVNFLYERYGYDKRWCFYVFETLIFVCFENHETNKLHVVTVTDMNYTGRTAYTTKNFGKRTKFKKK